MNKTLTIITVCYNSAQTIEKCLQSVTDQLTCRTEYLIIDGQSKDNTMELIEKYRIPNMTVISEPDNGIYDAMNKGILHAQGEWVWFINSDDYIKEGLVSELLSYIEANYYSDCIYGDMEYIRYINGKMLIEVKKAPDALNTLKNDMVIGHPSTICKRKVILDVGLFDVTFKIAADWDLFLRMYNKGHSFVHINKTFSRFYSGGASSKSHIIERHLVRKKNKSYNIIDIFYVRDCVKFFLYFLFKPFKTKILLKKLKKVQED